MDTVGRCACHGDERTGSYGPHKAPIQARLRRVEGQIRGLQRMVDEERYCVDVLTQLAAARAALDAVARTILEDHTRGCVAEALKRGDARETGESVEELVRVVMKFS